MVTTLVCTAGNRTKELWQFIEEASQADMRLAEMGHDSLNEISAKCTDRVPIYVHPTFYRSLKSRFPFDVGGISRRAELLLNFVPVPCVRPSASSPRRISSP